MDPQDSIVKKESAQEKGVTSEVGGENSSKIVREERKRRLSGPGSEGEKSLLKKNPVWLASPKAQIPVFNSCLCSLDEVVATPSFNVGVIEGACDKDFKFFDVINESKYVAFIDGALASLGFFAVSIGIYVIKYCKLRDIERNSNYFYFSRLFKACDEQNIKDKMGTIAQDWPINGAITYEYLQAAAYFYPPDISKIACWRRRFFASGKERVQLKALNEFLKKNSKEKMLRRLHKNITEKVCLLLNKEANQEAELINFQIIRYKKKWTIGLTNNYAKKIFNDVQHLINNNSENTLEENKDKKNRKFIPSILAALGQASFIYWILMFIFYFIPIAPVVTAAMISVIPLGIALMVALPALLIFKIRNAHQTYNNNENMNKDDIETQHKRIIEKKIVALNKQNIFLKFLQSKDESSSVELKNSPLMKDLHSVVKNRRFSKYHAICMGFLDGCFLPLFAGWLLLDGAKVILTYLLCPATVAFTSFTPIGLLATAIIAGVTLLLGVSYGVYTAYKANIAHEVRFDELQIKIKVLVDERGHKKILQKDYDRILRRFSDEQPIWTNCKKKLNRFVVVIKRLGTGSLVFRLVIWGPISATVAASTAVVPAFFPIILIIGTAIGAFVLAAWYLYAYNLESKTTQIERIMEYFVQSEQLADIDERLPSSTGVEGLDVQTSNTKQMVTLENLAKSENDQFISPESSDKKVSTPVVSTNADANTTQAEINTQRNNSNSSCALFKNTQDIGARDENMGRAGLFNGCV